MTIDKKLYTESLDSDTCALVRRIHARACDKFRSAVYTVDGDVYLQWRQAWHNNLTGTWVVDQYKAQPSLENTADANSMDVSSSRVYAGLCFFDALHMVASYDVFMTDLKRPCVQDSSILSAIGGQPHQDAASLENIPYDLTGLPIPAANGMIVVPGKYSLNAMQTAQKTVGNITENKNLPAVISTASALEQFGEKSQLPAIISTNVPALRTDTRNLVRRIEKVQAAFASLQKWEDHTRNFGYAPIDYSAIAASPFILAGTLLTFGTKVPVYSVPFAIMPFKGLDAAHVRFNKAVAALPDDHLRAGYTQWGNDLMLANAIAHASSIYRDRKSEARMNHATARIMKHGAAAGLTPSQIDALCLKARTGELPEYHWDIFKSVEDKYENLREDVRKIKEMDHRLQYNG